MAKIIVYNPRPRKKKSLTREQVEKRQDKAVQFLRDVADDPDMADEIEDLSVDEYAERKGFELVKNPSRRKRDTMKKEDLKEAVKDGVTEALKGAKDLLRRSNPNGQATPASGAADPKADRKKIISRVDDAAAALADGDEDEALDILNGLLDDFGD